MFYEIVELLSATLSASYQWHTDLIWKLPLPANFRDRSHGTCLPIPFLRLFFSERWIMLDHTSTGVVHGCQSQDVTREKPETDNLKGA